MTDSDNKKTNTTRQSSTSSQPESLEERRADPELLALHGIACPKATLEALRNLDVQLQTPQD